MDSDSQATTTRRVRLQPLLAVLLSGLYLLLFAVIGMAVALLGYCDPDTCWHLALGKWMFLHHGLPCSDPFSSNIQRFAPADPHTPLMQHEWLSEVIFYTAFSMGGLIAPLLLTAVLSAFSLVIVPLSLMRRNAVPNLLASAVVILAACASAFRLWVRPEAFSFLFMSLLILLSDLCQKGSRATALVCYVSVFGLMALWSNSHAVFVVGIAYLTGYSVLIFFDRYFADKALAASRSSPGKASADQVSLARRSSVTWAGQGALLRADSERALIMLGAAVLGTLVTPWQFTYWKFIYSLALSPVSHMNKENGPMTWTAMAPMTGAPLVVLFVVTIVVFVVALRTTALPKATQRSPLILACAGFFASVFFHRLTPLAMLVVIAAISFSHERLKLIVFNQQTAGVKPMLTPVGSILDALLQSRSGYVACVCLCALSCFATASYVRPPTAPSSSYLFSPPFAALRFLRAHPLPGRMFNDSKFGSMMTWDLEHSPDVFIDGRFCYYPVDVVYDYNTMRLCGTNWQQLLDKYKINWVFFPRATPLVTALAQRPGWSVVYVDSSAAILARSNSH